MTLQRFAPILIPLVILTSFNCLSINDTRHQDKKKKQDLTFQLDTDLLLLHYDCKTDVDDLHSVAAAASLIRIDTFSNLHYHAVAGAYGIQEGLYVPAEKLFSLAFGKNWSDAHGNFNQALKEVHEKCLTTLEAGGRLWIAEAGQSDFSARLIEEITMSNPKLELKNKITIVQHSDWNESVTDSNKLRYVKEKIDYIKIQDGNTEGNGTPGFNTKERVYWEAILKKSNLDRIWNLAIELAHKYNGTDHRYLNPTIKDGGFDFSDFSEVHYILNIKEVSNCQDYFNYLEKTK